MRFPLLLAAGGALLAGVLLAGDPAPVTYVDNEKVSVALTKGGALAKGDDFTVSGARRTGASQVEVHEQETDIFYIVDGEATFVTGGKMIGGKQTRANQWLGDDIQGGETHHLVKGDHQLPFPPGPRTGSRTCRSRSNYYMVKVLKP